MASIKQPVSFLFMHIGKLVKDKMIEALREFDLHLLQARVMMALARQGTVSQVDLANGLHIRPATVSNVVKKLERKGLITRRPSKNDDRSLRVSLTRKGHEATVHIREVFDRIDAEVVSIIPKKDVKRTQLFLKMVRDELGGKAPGI